MSQLSDRYSPKDVETKIYQWWMQNNYFRAEDVSTKVPFSITLPPPNVTGQLHMGHALDFSIQDLLIRWKKMSGFNAMWMPGIDHAGIATQNVVEKMLWKDEKLDRKTLGREKFLERVWQWKNQYGERIVEQCKAMGYAMDWERMRFTLDDKSNAAVLKVFVDLYKQGLIYRGTKLVNWSSKLESAISDLEVEHKETKGSMWHIKYPIENSNEFLTVATTRPETLLGDTAVAVNPDDERYKHLIGKNVILPVCNRKIAIIADSYVDKDFGSGVVKITPAHDFNDYQVGLRHKLEMINLLNVDGTFNQNAGANYQGLTAPEAREKILAELKEKDLFIKEDPHTLQTPICSRTGCVVEPMLSQQWFMRMEKLATPARHVVESETITFEPESWTKTYLHWMNNIEDWCISRQLWWGHRIPVFYCDKCSHMNVSVEAPTECEKCHHKSLTHDQDVLDTWFSSALWPFSTLGWPENTEALKTFYPTNVLVTGPDIIFFWVARMIMMGLHFCKDVPFRKVYLHGIVRDSQGRKMSKSLGNGIDPLEIVESDGADALRFTLIASIAGGKDLKFSKERLEGYRNFMNKIWNATRFSLNAMENKTLLAAHELPKTSNLSLADRWITFKLGQCMQEVETALEAYRFSDAAMALYSFTWNDLCDWYLEFIKPTVYGEDTVEKMSTLSVLAQSLNRVIRMLHPFVPFISEEIYQKLPYNTEACITAEYPTLAKDKVWLSLGDAESAAQLDLVKDVISAIRNIRGENRIKQNQKIKAFLLPNNDHAQKILGENKDALMRLAGLDECDILADASKQKSAVALISTSLGKVEVVIPLTGLVDFDEEIKRIQKNIEKANKEFMGIQGKLNNENFVKNAPKDIVESDQARIVELKEMIHSLQSAITRLQ